VIVIASVLLLAVAASPVQVVQGAGDGCPASAEVELALASMLTSPSGAAPASRDVARLERVREALHVKLVDPQGGVIAERTVAGSGSCAELAQITAIVIASWESDVHPEFVREPAEIVQVRRPPTPEPPTAIAPPRPAAAYDVGGGVSLAQADTLAPGASIGAAWFPRGAGPGLWVLGAGDISRTVAVGSHQARWRRWMASLEVTHRWTRGQFAIDPHGGLALGWVMTEGVDYTQNRSDSAFSLGGTVGIRLGQWFSRRAAVWVDLRGYFFARQASVYGTGAGTTVDETALPSWGAVASVGLALGRGPLSR
jgi:hypothetical protein